MKYAGFWIRFCAVFVDGLLFMPFTGANALCSHFGLRNVGILLILAGFLAANFYPSFCHYRWGQTLGKYLLDIRVVPLEGRRLSLIQSVLRSSIDIGIATLSTAISVILMLSIPAEEFSSERFNHLVATSPSTWFLLGLSVVWGLATAISVAAHPEKRAIHDLIAGTKAVRFAGQAPVPAAEPVPSPAP